MSKMYTVFFKVQETRPLWKARSRWKCTSDKGLEAVGY